MESIEDIRPQHVGESLDANAEQENLDVLDEIEPIDDAELPSECIESHHKEKNTFKPILVESEDVLCSMARMASEEQMLVFCKMIDYYIRVAMLNNGINIEIEPE